MPEYKKNPNTIVTTNTTVTTVTVKNSISEEDKNEIIKILHDKGIEISFRDVKNRQPLYIIIEGIIGAGKSTLTQIISEEFRKRSYKVVILGENAAEWVKDGSLPRFYANKKREAFYFQCKVFNSKMEIMEEKYREFGNDVDVYISDRSIHSDQFFVEVLYKDGDMTNYEYKEYKKWWKRWNKKVPLVPNLFIYLNVSIDECDRRITERNRKGEAGLVSKEYQTKLKNEHDKFFNCEKIDIDGVLVPSLVMKTDEDFRTNGDKIFNIIELVIR